MISLGRTAKTLPFFAKSAPYRVHKSLTERGHNVYFGSVQLRRRELRIEPKFVGKLGRPLTLMHNTVVVSFLTFGEKEGSCGRHSWAERREGDCEARLGVLQEAPSKAKES
jgi:hypothetical protein